MTNEDILRVGWRTNACAGSIGEDDRIHELARDAAQETTRLRILLADKGLKGP